MRDSHETSKVGYGNLANLFDPRCSLWRHVAAGGRRHVTPTTV